jgi:ubiquinone/menaquinone biosynthesis C-methylase UbiE
VSCFYCDRIRRHAPAYAAQDAAFDLASEAPRCPRHWRIVCGACGRADHFMAVAYCAHAGKPFCRRCAPETREVPADFWGFAYYFEYRSPWSGAWCPALDRLEFEARHALTEPEALAAMLAPETDLPRYPPRPRQWRLDRDVTEEDSRVNWNGNAVRWAATYDEDGDSNRRYQSDEPMLAMLGDVEGRSVVDVGSGNGYLCRKLARLGATVTGVELSDAFLEIARGHEAREPAGITYVHGSVARMDVLAADTFDKAVSNYVLMDVRDYEAAVREVFRVLKRGGPFVVVISHPAFDCGPASWVVPAPDSPRPEDRTGYVVDDYFRRGPLFAVWGDIDPVLSFHRPLRDYWRTFQHAGFRVDDFEEPSITARGRRELPPSRVPHALRVPWSCIFRLVKP